MSPLRSATAVQNGSAEFGGRKSPDPEKVASPLYPVATIFSSLYSRCLFTEAVVVSPLERGEGATTVFNRRLHFGGSAGAAAGLALGVKVPAVRRGWKPALVNSGV